MHSQRSRVYNSPVDSPGVSMLVTTALIREALDCERNVQCYKTNSCAKTLCRGQESWQWWRWCDRA